MLWLGLLTPVLPKLSLELLLSGFLPCSSAPNPPRRRKQGVAERGQAKEKQQRRPEAIAGHVVSRVDVEEVRTLCCPSRAGLPLSSNPVCSRSGAECLPDTPFCLGPEEERRGETEPRGWSAGSAGVSKESQTSLPPLLQPVLLSGL